MPTKYSSPLTFEVDENSYQKLEDIVRRSGARSISQVIRVALDSFDFSRFEKEVSHTRQLSVRLDDDLRARLTRVTSEKNASFGEVLRAALGALSDKPLREVVRETQSTNMPKKPSRKAAVKKTAKKAAKKVTKKAAKKVAPKQAAKKAARKAATKKVAKKAAKKVATKKAAKKATRKVAKKATKKAAKKATKKAAKKATKKAAKKAPTKKKAAKKVAKKAAKKVAKKAARKRR